MAADRRYDVGAMDFTLLIGIAVITLGAGAGAFLMFGHRTDPLTETTTVNATLPRRTTVASSAPRPDTGGDVRIRWYQRVRSGLILLLIVVGLGTSIGAVVGGLAMAVTLLMG